ncbi:hypothetical protein BDD12DRAFT_883955 [Trichophaea hybrida]|nr:hypothetical protein BDD12DRAFT_883955 [Trichophaea hybrida]
MTLPASESRQFYGVIVHLQLLESPGTPVQAPGIIDRTFYELVISIPGAFEDIADSSFDEIYNDLSSDLQDLLFASEEGEANFQEDIFYYVSRGAGRYTPKPLPHSLPITPCPLIQNHSLIYGSWMRSLSQSSRIQDLGDEDLLPNTAALTSRFCVRPIIPERMIFTSDFGYDHHFQYHYRHPYDEDEDLSTPPSDNEDSRRAFPAPDNMANNNNKKNMYFGFLRDLKYDGRTPIKDFLTDFGNIKNEIATLDPNFPGPMWLTLLCAPLNDTESPPKAGVDGGPDIGPRTWVACQRTTDIDTYNKIRRLHPDLSKVTVKEFSEQFNEVIGVKEIAMYVLSEIFVAKKTPPIVSKFKYERNWRKKTFNNVVKLLNDIDESIRHADPLFPNRSAAMDSGVTAQWYRQQA